MPKKTRNTGLPKIKQLPSGAYHAQVYSHTDENGKRRYESFTSYDYAALVTEIAQFKQDKKEERINASLGRRALTLADAFEKYIQSKSAVLSPSTIVGYRKIQRNYLKGLMPRKVDELTQEQIQIAINEEAMRLSPKTVRDTHGLLSSVLRVYRPEFTLYTRLPQKERTEIVIPDEHEVVAMINAAKGTDMEIPVYLGACCGLRRSEISALTWDCIDFKKDTITVKSALVLNEDREFVRKSTKTTAGTRTIRMFPIVKDALLSYKKDAEANGTYAPDIAITVSPTIITKHFSSLQDKAGTKHYRFHDLRHYAVSVMLSLNIPKNYIADYVGHETENMIDRVYGHILKSKKTSVEDVINDYYQNLLMQNEKQN